jgi:sigma-B regulation protein RsbU (phosphoserine phosphatase)
VETTSRTEIAWRWLSTTFSGRLLLAGVVLKLIAAVLKLGRPESSALAGADTIADVLIVIAALTIGYYLFVDIKRLVLWRVRRKLILSYIFIGFVPALLIICFFVLVVLLLFFNVSAYSVRMQMAAFQEQARFLAQSAAVEVAGGLTPSDVARALRTRFASAILRYPLVSYAAVPSARACEGDQVDIRRSGESADLSQAVTAGPWEHVDAPDSVPQWVSCDGQTMLIAFRSGDDTYIAARAVEWVPGHPREAVIVDLPIDPATLQKIAEDVGIETGPIATTEDIEARENDPQASRRLIFGPASVPAPGARESSPVLSGLSWVALLDHINWATGQQGTLLMSFKMSPWVVYDRISGPGFRGIGSFSFAQVLLMIMGAVGGLFLVIQLVALGMGMALARSITGAVHELFEGTERVGQGDFSHKIAVHSRDQLGELAASFNSMTTSIEYLLQEKAEKERLEQELRIARTIQMSLLPQGPLQMPGLTLMSHCEPAREVGGDYYDYVPIDRDRLGLLIADVSGKGTSAALYMAELKGIILSLSQRHTSPRELLINANQIISRHLDTRSFITITYAVVDLRAHTLTYARAGHCPLIFVPGSHAVDRSAQVLVPDGMVLGLQIDEGQMFERFLEESTIRLGPGDLFLFYTDGMSEAMNKEGECFGDARLAALLERHADLPPAEIRERILRDVQGFAGTEAQQDDMTLLLLVVQALPHAEAQNGAHGCR